MQCRRARGHPCGGFFLLIKASKLDLCHVTVEETGRNEGGAAIYTLFMNGDQFAVGNAMEMSMIISAVSYFSENGILRVRSRAGDFVAAPAHNEADGVYVCLYGENDPAGETLLYAEAKDSELLNEGEDEKDVFLYRVDRSDPSMQDVEPIGRVDHEIIEKARKM